MPNSNYSSVFPGKSPLIIITGLSGAGKSTAVRFLEDMGYYCADNLPPAIIPTFVHLCTVNRFAPSGTAIVSDVRSGDAFADFEETVKVVTDSGISCEIVFLDCDTDTLIRRFKEVRREHPLQASGLSMEEAIEEERKRLTPVRNIATRIVDTGNLSAMEFRKVLSLDLFGADKSEYAAVKIVSFGFKYGLPKDVDFTFDVRFLPNPYYIAEMKQKTGMDSDVYDYVMSFEKADSFFEHVSKLLEITLSAFKDKGKRQVIVGIGCTGGRHRSVASAVRLHQYFLWKKIDAVINHRDVNKPQQ